MTVFFGVFLVAGLFILFIATLRPLWMAAVSRGWDPVDCLIDSSEVGVHGGSDGDTYSVEIWYRYRFEGRVYQFCAATAFTPSPQAGTPAKRRWSRAIQWRRRTFAT